MNSWRHLGLSFLSMFYCHHSRPETCLSQPMTPFSKRACGFPFSQVCLWGVLPRPALPLRPSCCSPLSLHHSRPGATWKDSWLLSRHCPKQAACVRASLYRADGRKGPIWLCVGKHPEPQAPAGPGSQSLQYRAWG